MPEPLRIDLFRDAERELRQAFELGEFDAALREHAAAFARVGLAQPEWLAAIRCPGDARELACYNLAKAWAAQPCEAASAVEYARRQLTVRDEWSRAPVIQLRPAPAPKRPFLASLVDRYQEFRAEFRPRLDEARAECARELADLRAQQAQRAEEKR